MPHERDALRLDPIPASVSRARRVVAERLRNIGRDDLVESAQLVVSELVTNALLHAGAPITLRVRGTPRHPRVEVGDRSLDLPTLPIPVPLPGQRQDRPTVGARGGVGTLSPQCPEVDLDALTTSGRGIRIVMTHSASWGIDRSLSAKVVWFEPAPEPRLDAPCELQVFEVGDLNAVGVPEPRADTGEAGQDAPSASTTCPVRLLRTPVLAIAAMRRHYDDLQREIRLIGLQYGRERSALPSHLFDQAAQPDLHRLRAIGTEELLAAVRRGEVYADLDYRVAPVDAADFARTIALLLEADDYCRQERLLTLALSPRQRAIVVWMCEQITWQVAGGSPSPWHEEPSRRG